jgi:hypothetical protein
MLTLAITALLIQQMGIFPTWPLPAAYWSGAGSGDSNKERAQWAKGSGRGTCLHSDTLTALHCTAHFALTALHSMHLLNSLNSLHSLHGAQCSAVCAHRKHRHPPAWQSYQAIAIIPGPDWGWFGQIWTSQPLQPSPRLLLCTRVCTYWSESPSHRPVLGPCVYGLSRVMSKFYSYCHEHTRVYNVSDHYIQRLWPTDSSSHIQNPLSVVRNRNSPATQRS